MAVDLLIPRGVLSSPHKARARVAIVAGAAAGACGLAGCWIRFADGVGYRASLGITSAIFAAITVSTALGARSVARSVLRAIAIAGAFGVASILVPSVLASGQERIPFYACIVFGAFFGVFTGLAYGAMLSVASALTWRNIASGTHEGADRALRRAAGWALVPIAIAFATAIFVDAAPISEFASRRQVTAHEVGAPLGLLGASIALVVAGASFVLAQVRIARRRRWVAEVVADDPRWTLRAPLPHDHLGALPRLSDGGAVLEYRGEAEAYRVSSGPRAVAML